MLLHEGGKPVVAIWGKLHADPSLERSFDNDQTGMGMKHNPQSAESLSRLLQWMHDFTPGGVYIFAGSPSHWRTRDGDCSEDEAYLKLWQQVDCVSCFGELELTSCLIRLYPRCHRGMSAVSVRSKMQHRSSTKWQRTWRISKKRMLDYISSVISRRSL
jgi:hypothetical protein